MTTMTHVWRMDPLKERRPGVFTEHLGEEKSGGRRSGIQRKDEEQSDDRPAAEALFERTKAPGEYASEERRDAFPLTPTFH